MKKLFSERYGYTKPSDVIIREQITPEIQNAICSCFDNFDEILRHNAGNGRYISYDDCHREYIEMERYLWRYFFNKREGDYNKYNEVLTCFLMGTSNWYRKLDLLEMSIKYLRHNEITKYMVNVFVSNLNSEFERLHFAYRIIKDEIVEINSAEEVQSIETALKEAPSNIRTHLSRALELYAQRPNGDYSNSIKESISAVEAYCREKTGANDLGDALKNLEKKGLVIPVVLKQAFEKLYAYTNQPTTGIRHALMDATGTYTPQAEEAIFMLVSCSTFINYLNRKVQ